MLQLLVATGQGNVAYLEVEGGKLKQVGHHKLDTEVACLDITPVGQGPFITPPPFFMSAQLMGSNSITRCVMRHVCVLSHAACIIR